MTNFPNGLKSRGVPVMGGGGGIPVSTGDYYFVDSATGNSGYSGKSSSKPLATIDQAINKCTANKGDVVVVMPNHSETIVNATGLVPDVAGVQIIGLGEGGMQPQVKLDTATSAEVIVTGASTVIQNINFTAALSAIATCIDVNAHDVVIRDCKFDYESTGDDFLIMVDVDAFDRTKIVNNKMVAQAATAGAAEAIRIDDANYLEIDNNTIMGDYSLAAIANPTADALGIGLMIRGNYIYNDDTASAVNGIALQNACTGLIAYNTVGSLYATAIDTLIDPGSCLTFENYACNAIDEYAAILPGTTASS